MGVFKTYITTNLFFHDIVGAAGNREHINVNGAQPPYFPVVIDDPKTYSWSTIEFSRAGFKIILKVLMFFEKYLFIADLKPFKKRSNCYTV